MVPKLWRNVEMHFPQDFKYPLLANYIMDPKKLQKGTAWTSSITMVRLRRHASLGAKKV